jgi:hypothetical protein
MARPSGLTYSEIISPLIAPLVPELAAVFG